VITCRIYILTHAFSASTWAFWITGSISIDFWLEVP
jgi:hypothetical protein